jgi:hypothetical protein
MVKAMKWSSLVLVFAVSIASVPAAAQGTLNAASICRGSTNLSRAMPRLQSMLYRMRNAQRAYQISIRDLNNARLGRQAAQRNLTQAAQYMGHHARACQRTRNRHSCNIWRTYRSPGGPLARRRTALSVRQARERNAHSNYLVRRRQLQSIRVGIDNYVRPHGLTLRQVEKANPADLRRRATGSRQACYAAVRAISECNFSGARNAMRGLRGAQLTRVRGHYNNYVRRAGTSRGFYNRGKRANVDGNNALRRRQYHIARRLYRYALQQFHPARANAPCNRYRTVINQAIAVTNRNLARAGRLQPAPGGKRTRIFHNPTYQGYPISTASGSNHSHFCRYKGYPWAGSGSTVRTKWVRAYSFSSKRVVVSQTYGSIVCRR